MSKEFTYLQLKKAIDKFEGNITAASRYLKISRPTFYKKIKPYSSLERLIKEYEASFKLEAVDILKNQIRSENMTALIFYLKCKCGWTENHSSHEEEIDNEPDFRPIIVEKVVDA